MKIEHIAVAVSLVYFLSQAGAASISNQPQMSSDVLNQQHQGILNRIRRFTETCPFGTEEMVIDELKYCINKPTASCPLSSEEITIDGEIHCVGTDLIKNQIAQKKQGIRFRRQSDCPPGQVKLYLHGVPTCDYDRYQDRQCGPGSVEMYANGRKYCFGS